MSKVQKTIKIPNDVYQAAESWISKNGSVINFSVLTEMAIRRFITEPQIFEAVTLDKDEALAFASKALKDHKPALDRMK